MSKVICILFKQTVVLRMRSVLNAKTLDFKGLVNRFRFLGSNSIPST
jgi:hypothetical protein